MHAPCRIGAVRAPCRAGFRAEREEAGGGVCEAAGRGSRGPVELATQVKSSGNKSVPMRALDGGHAAGTNRAQGAEQGACELGQWHCTGTNGNVGAEGMDKHQGRVRSGHR